LVAKNERLRIHEIDICEKNIGEIKDSANADYIIHMASIASPTYYRKYPIETFNANVIGLKVLLELFAKRDISGFLFFSSSEVYGDPFPEFIPTDEEYRGNVATMGPRACYDEAKRCCETMCYLYAKQYKMPIAVVRPFNNYGPGMNINDKRVPADFCKAVLEGKDIEIFSDGSPTRTFCYITDAITGYIKAMTKEGFDYFNIGNDNPEISIRDLADIFIKAGQDIYGYDGKVKFTKPPEADYLVDNPNRRCPNIDKARKLLGYDPKVDIKEGVKRFIGFLKEKSGEV
jgi:UDP-glucuronate decarboxylase